MKYITDFETGKQAILEKYPELRESKFEADSSGWTNFAIRADGKYLFRFPRNEEAYKAVGKESKILTLLHEKLPPTIRVPNYIYSSLDTDHPFVGYELIEGRFLTQKVFDGLSGREKDNLLTLMAEFLTLLHSIDHAQFHLTVTDPIQWYENLYKRVQKICFPYFEEALKAATVKLFEDFFQDETMHNYTPTLIHGDLSEDHILITKDGIGIIDFGDVMVFDPAYDFIWAYLCDNGFYRELFNRYSGRKDAYFEHRIRDFHRIRPPYDGILYADETRDVQLLERERTQLRQNLGIPLQ